MNNNNNNISVRNKKYNNISVWYCQYGTDEMKCVAGCDCEFDQEFIDKNVVNFECLEGVKVEDFCEEERGDKWVMFGFDGIGVLCSDVNVETAHAEYESLCD